MIDRTPPTLQKSQSFGFALYDGKTAVVPFLELAFRPEELSVIEPSRMAVTQTLGGAWIDSHGEGITTFNIAGHTGWRYDAQNQYDGLGRLQQLRDVVFKRWHGLRAEKSKAGQDPDTVQLFFVNDADSISCIVAPGQFQLKRSKSSPLLARYTIAMTKLRDANIAKLDAIDVITEDIEVVPAMAALQASVGDLQAVELGQLKSSPLGELVLKNIDLWQEVLKNGLNPESNGFLNKIAPVLYVAKTVAKISRGLCEVQMLTGQYGELFKGTIRQVSQLFNEAYCNLSGLLNGLATTFDFKGLLGTSNCASSRGAARRSMFAELNVFEAIFATPPSAPIIGGGGYDALEDADQDPLDLAQLPPDALEQITQAVAQAVVVGQTQTTIVGQEDSTARPEVLAALAESPFVKDAPPVRRALVKRGDTIQRFALRELGDASRWPEIVSLNQLLPPYITDSSVDIGVASAGQTLLVPDLSNRAGTRIKADDDSVYKRDCWVQNGDLVVQNGDIAVLGGYKNFSQALRIRLDTSEGELLYHPNYGTRARTLVGQNGSASLLTLAKGFITSSLTQDPRVARLNDLRVTVLGDRLSIDGTAVTVDAALIPFNQAS